jgi:hypothetical protein
LALGVDQPDRADTDLFINAVTLVLGWRHAAAIKRTNT